MRTKDDFRRQIKTQCFNGGNSGGGGYHSACPCCCKFRFHGRNNDRQLLRRIVRRRVKLNLQNEIQ